MSTPFFIFFSFFYISLKKNLLENEVVICKRVWYNPSLRDFSLEGRRRYEYKAIQKYSSCGTDDGSDVFNDRL